MSTQHAETSHAKKMLQAARNEPGANPNGPYARFGRAVEKLARLPKRALPYDDRTATFTGGEMKKLTERNYEPALRRLWKAESIAPELEFHDANWDDIRAAESPADATMRDISAQRHAIASAEFERKLQENYTPRQRQALARLLSVILHGEAYALFVSASLLPVVRGTGAKLAMSTQVLEEAKHFIVMRELVERIDRIYPQSVWDYVLLEGVLKAKPMNRLFGMNVVVESVAMNFFSTFATFPGLENVLGLFHLDESRHSGFPQTYTQEAPLSFMERHSPARQFSRLWLITPLAGLLFDLEDDAAAVGIDIFEFGGKCVDKVFRLSERSGFYPLLNRKDAHRGYNLLINSYKKYFSNERDRYSGWIDFMLDRTIQRDSEMKKIEEEIFGTEDRIRGALNKALDPAKNRLADSLSSLMRLQEPAVA